MSEATMKYIREARSNVDRTKNTYEEALEKYVLARYYEVEAVRVHNLPDMEVNNG